MLLLVSLAVAAGVALLLAPLMVLRYLLSAPVLLFVMLFLALLAAPLAYLWRTGPFRR